MALPTGLTTLGRSGWAPSRRLMPVAFVGQGLSSFVAWFLVNDRSRRGAWSNSDFGQWLVLSLVCAVLAGVFSGLLTRQWAGALAVVSGCALAVVSGCALFVGYAVVNSA